MALRAALVDEQLIADRERLGIDRRDEVWEGVYVMVPPARLPHQQTAFDIATALRALGVREVNLSVGVGYKENYRVPDVAVYDAAEVDEQALYVGRARLVVEVMSPGEDPHAKLGFYAAHAEEVLLVLPDRLELFVGGRLVEPEPTGEGWLVGGTAAVRREGGELLISLPVDRSVTGRVPLP